MYGTRFIKETELRLDLLKLLPNHIGYDFDVESLKGALVQLEDHKQRISIKLKQNRTLSDNFFLDNYKDYVSLVNQAIKFLEKNGEIILVP